MSSYPAASLGSIVEYGVAEANRIHSNSAYTTVPLTKNQLYVANLTTVYTASDKFSFLMHFSRHAAPDSKFITQGQGSGPHLDSKSIVSLVSTVVKSWLDYPWTPPGTLNMADADGNMYQIISSLIPEELSMPGLPMMGEVEVSLKSVT